MFAVYHSVLQQIESVLQKDIAFNRKLLWSVMAVQVKYKSGFVIISYRMSGFDMTGNLTGTMSSDKLGVTTTVKEQVEHIESAVVHFKSALDQQRKMQSELELQVKKLNEKTHKDFDDMLKETTDRAEQLVESFKSENNKQEKEFNYMDMQNSSISEDHVKMKEVSSDIGGRTGEIQAKVGV